jgi:hypothetical protein
MRAMCTLAHYQEGPQRDAGTPATLWTLSGATRRSTLGAGTALSSHEHGGLRLPSTRRSIPSARQVRGCTLAYG